VDEPISFVGRDSRGKEVSSTRWDGAYDGQASLVNFNTRVSIWGRVKTAEEIRERLERWREVSAQFSQLASVRGLLGWVPSELEWVLGEDDSGALRRVLWVCLIAELHDAECTMRQEGPDLVLEGRARVRTFRFWLRLIHGEFSDQRSSALPIEKIWILYEKPTDTGFVFTAQDDTLSGTIQFSAEDFEFRMWDHADGTTTA